MVTPSLLISGVLILLVIYVAYRIGKVLLRVFIGLAVLALVSLGLWKLFHS
ncbi:MAG: hypothetical protein WAS25_05385 [Geothrix sp.]|uniref:hypothetical protein n=1 Tax=Geothrix sp. TaxID=1962974 RepID=UPI003BB171D2